MKKNKIKNLLLSWMIIPIISFSSIIPLEVGSYIDPVTGYNSERVYDFIEANVSFLDLRDNDMVDDEGVSVIRDEEPLSDALKKVQDILEKADYSMKEIDIAIDNINDRSKLKKFFIGNNLRVLSFQLVQIKNQIYLLNHLAEDIEAENIRTKIESQVEFLEKKEEMVEKFILEQKDKFSLLSWFVIWF